MVLDLSYTDINLSDLKPNKNWTTFYGDAKKAKPNNAPKPLGKEIELIMFVDSDYAGDKKKRSSCTGYMIFMNMSMIYCNTKK